MLWSKVVKPQSDECQKDLIEYSQKMKAPTWVADLLYQRECRDIESARVFFRPQDRGVHDSGDMNQLTEFVEALGAMDRRAVKIVVHGDYDVDGITGTALLYLGLRKAGFEQVDTFLPSRFHEGYGLTIPTIDRFVQDNVTWIFTVDTGITAVEEVAYAQSKGIKVAVMDHHQEGPELPQADFILNPQQKSCSYPNPFLCAAGVTYKVVEALWSQAKLGRADELLDLFTLGTLADMMPVQGENRTLLKKGLHLLRNSNKPGIRELLKHAKIETPDLRSQDVLFRLTPLLNSSGRMGSPNKALELLLSKDPQNAAHRMAAIQETNTERRAIEEEVWNAALKAKRELEDREGTQEVLVLAHRDWHQGVIGIVAAKLVEKFGIPTAVCAIDAEGSAKGSCRTPPGYNWHKALASQQNLLGKWGGHAFAAGFSLDGSNLSAFRHGLNQEVKQLHRETIEADDVQTHVCVDMREINSETLDWLGRFEPFGHGNPSPVFYDSGVLLARECRVVAKKHLKIRLKKGRKEFDCIAFGLGHLAKDIQRVKSPLEIAYIPMWNYFRNQKSIQLQVMGIKHSNIHQTKA